MTAGTWCRFVANRGSQLSTQLHRDRAVARVDSIDTGGRPSCSLTVFSIDGEPGVRLEDVPTHLLAPCHPPTWARRASR